MADYRVEHDSMGEVRVPADARWGAQTQRAVENFPISGEPVDVRVIRALALIKREAAAVSASGDVAVNRQVGSDRRAADDVVGSATAACLDRHFQTGSGTSTNMDMNEVLCGTRLQRAGRAGLRASQRPGERLAVVQRRVPVGRPRRSRAGARRQAPLPQRSGSEERFGASSAEFGTSKSGRTHLMG